MEKQNHKQHSKYHTLKQARVYMKKKKLLLKTQNQKDLTVLNNNYKWIQILQLITFHLKF